MQVLIVVVLVHGVEVTFFRTYCSSVLMVNRGLSKIHLPPLLVPRRIHLTSAGSAQRLHGTCLPQA